MEKTHKNLTIRVCGRTVDSVELSILSLLESLGHTIDTRYGDPEQWCDSNSSSYDCLLVDWRTEDVATTDYFKQQAGREPVIALIKEDQAIGDLNSTIAFNDFVCEKEIGLAAFPLRLFRLIARYRDPLSLDSTNAPEASLLQTIVNHSTDWLFIKDLSHRFLSVSEEYVNTLDRDLDGVIGKNDLEIGFSEDVVIGSEQADWPGFWPQDENAIANGEPTVETSPYWRVFTGDTRHRRTIRVPLKNRWDEVYALLVCSEDITTIVKTEQILQERSEMLSKVTKEKNKADQSRKVAELAVTAKNKFIATASHDLRQPLHALGLYLDVLETKVVGEEKQALITKIKNSSTALSVLFNSLLDLSRLDAGIVDVDSVHFPIKQLLLNLREEFEEVATDKSLEITINYSDTVVYTDAILLERVLRNLIQNAVAYTLEGSVKVTCELLDEYLRIDIADTGPGILQVEQDAIFSEFYQVEQEGRRSTMGLGLGLAIVRRLVDLLGIKFELQSKIGEGSVFTLQVPIGNHDQVQDQSSTSITTGLDGQAILVIDDEVEILDGMSHLLEAHGCVPIIAKTVKEAIQLLTERDLAPAMIVADYQLQHGETGEDAIEFIREEFNSDIPAIIITGDTSADRLKEATRSGLRLLHKPVTADDLLTALSHTLLENNANR